MNIIVAAGGTLGHINPALVIAEELIRLNNKVYFITLEKNTINIDRCEILKYNAYTFNRKKLFRNFKAIIKNNNIKNRISKFIKEKNINLVISFGSSIGTLSIKASYKFKNVKRIIHEQNAIMGLGNKLVCNKVDKVLLTYDNDIKGVVVGNPVSHFNIRKNICNNSILVTCGTNGSKKINDFFINNFNDFLKCGYKIYLVTGDKYYNENYNKIKNIESDNFIIYPKQKSLSFLYEKCDVIICRSGSTTLSEVLFLNKLIITIPSPNVTNNHQEVNAKYYEQKGCLEIINENDLQESKDLIDMIYLMKKNRYKYLDNIKKCYIYNSKELFINEIYSCVRENE